MNRKKFYNGVNDIITNNVYLSKPFITILRNPAIFDQEIINEINSGLIYKLEQREEDLNRDYQRVILPMISPILTLASGRNHNTPSDWRNISREDLKSKLRRAIETNHLPFGKKTLNAIRDKGKVDEEILVANFRLNNQRIDTYREKSIGRIREKQVKYLLEFFGSSEDITRERELYYNFFLDAIGEKSFWNEYKFFQKTYENSHERIEKAMKTISPDVFGVKRIELDQKYANKRMNLIAGNPRLLDKHGMAVIPELVDDHRETLRKGGGQGGLHLPMIDKQTGLHPIEVQYQGPTTAIYDLCGMHAHHLYELRQHRYNSKELGKISGPLF